MDKCTTLHKYLHKHIWSSPHLLQPEPGNKWKCKSRGVERKGNLGWFPNPNGEYTEFSNSILPKFKLSFWTTCPYKVRYRRCFVTEWKRQWEVREALKVINHKLAFVTSDNPATAERFMGKHFSANAMMLPRFITTLMIFRSRRSTSMSWMRK